MNGIQNDSKKKEPEGKSEGERKELRAIAISVLFMVLSFVVLWVTKTVVDIEGDAVFVSLLFIPVLVYAVVSDRLKELKGPGGLEATFAEAATTSPIKDSKTLDIDEGMQIIDKAGGDALRKRLQELNKAQPIVMTMVLGRDYSYTRVDILDYIGVLSEFRNFKFVVFLDNSDRFVAYMREWGVKGLLSKQELGDEFVRVINAGRLQDLLGYPGVERDTISTQSTNAEALREMTRQNLEALVVIDEDRRLRGVVEREQVLSRMMLALTK